jgi:beta-lactamase class A
VPSRTSCAIHLGDNNLHEDVTLKTRFALLTCLFIAHSLTAQSRLQQNIERVTRSVNARWGIYVKCLETGEEVTINADQQMDTMSVIKIPLMAEAFRQIGEGKFKLTDRVTLEESAKRPGTGIIRSLDAGATLTIKDLLTLMIIVSDNTATDLIFDKVGGVEPVNRLMQNYGLSSTRATGPASVWFAALRAAPSAAEFHQQAKTPFGLSSPRDMGKLLERIATGKAVSPEASAQMLQMMRGQVYSSRLPKYVTGFRVAHKTGDFLPYIGNDVGIFESDKRHVVVSVFTAGHTGVGSYLEDAIGRIGELIANAFALDISL